MKPSVMRAKTHLSSDEIYMTMLRQQQRYNRVRMEAQMHNASVSEAVREDDTAKSDK